METDWKKFVEITLEYAIRVVHIQSLPEALQYVKEAGVVEDQILSGNLNWVTTRWLELRQLPPTPQSLPEQMTQHDDSLDNEAYVRTEDVPNFDREEPPFIMKIFCGSGNCQPANFKFCEGSNCFMKLSTARKKKLDILNDKTTLSWCPLQDEIQQYNRWIWYNMECIVLDDKEMDIQVDVLVGKDRSPEVLGNDTSMEVSGQQGVMMGHTGIAFLSHMQQMQPMPPISPIAQFLGQTCAVATATLWQQQFSGPVGGHQMSHQTAGVTYPNSDLMGLAQVPPPRLGNLSSSPVANLPGAQGGPRPWNPMEMGARNPMASEADAGLGYPNGPGFATASNRDALQSNNTMNQGGNQRKRKADDIMDPSDSNAAGRKRRSFASGGTQDPSTLESLPG